MSEHKAKITSSQIYDDDNLQPYLLCHHFGEHYIVIEDVNIKLKNIFQKI